jgi:hypothetical protein
MLFVSSFSWPHQFTKVWAHRTSLSPPFRLEMPVPSQESEWPCNCVLRGIPVLGGIPVSILPLSTIFLLDFRTDPTVWYFLELIRQCGILELIRQCGILELIRQCGIF